MLEAASLRFYLDEHLDIEIARQLVRQDIDVVTVPQIRTFGEGDPNQLERATNLGRVFCTHDSDLVDLASQGVEHAGIVFGQQEKHFTGTWVKFLKRMTVQYRPDEMVNMVVYVKTID